MPKLILAPNALKGSCTAAAAATAMARGAARALPGAELVELPVADGGDGLAAVLRDAIEGEARTVRVAGPRFQPVDATLIWSPSRRIAVVEMALGSGLALLAEQDRDATTTTTLGTGELLRAALDLGATHIIVGLGGSATNDGGIGMAEALGWRFTDAPGRPVAPVGGRLADIACIDGSARDARLTQIRIEAVCDVDNPLTGPRGAATIYGPQKGASPAQVAALDAGLAHLAGLIQRDLGLDIAELPGAGAAGGLGAGLIAFAGATLRPGAELVLDLLKLDQHLADADLVLTAEGRIDAQTAHGKAPAAVAARAKAHGVPCIAIAGGIGDGLDVLHALGMDAVFSLCRGPMTLAEAERDAEALLAEAAEQVVRAFFARR
jgi:glycerate 2-kinase